MSLNQSRLDSLEDKVLDKAEQAKLIQDAEEKKASEEVKRSEEAKTRKIKRSK